MSNNIVQLNEEITKGANQGIGSGNCKSYRTVGKNFLKTLLIFCSAPCIISTRLEISFFAYIGGARL